MGTSSAIWQREYKDTARTSIRRILGMSFDLTKKDRMSAAPFVELLRIEPILKWPVSCGKFNLEKTRKHRELPANTRKVLTASTARPLFDDESCGFAAGRGAATSGGSRPKSWRRFAHTRATPVVSNLTT